jgi:hypothetical protein
VMMLFVISEVMLFSACSSHTRFELV